MAKRYHGKPIALIPALVTVFILSGCSIAQKVPESYLTEDYLALPAVASAEPQAESSSAPSDLSRTFAQPQKPKTGKPPKPVIIAAPPAGTATGGTSGTATAASSSGTSSETILETVTYKHSETNDRQETLGNVEISSPDVVLANKYIKGNLTVTADAYGSFSLTHCKVAGTVTIKGDIDTLELVDTTLESLYLYSGYDITVNLEGSAYIMGTYLKGTDAVLNAYNISHDYSGYNVITIERYSSTTTYLEVHGADCKTIINDSESVITLDNSAQLTFVERFIANAATTVFGAGQIEVLNASAKDILLHGIPGKVIYDENKYDAPTITD